MIQQNILFTCAGRRNYLINYFKAAMNGNGIIMAADQQKLAPALAEADIALQVPNIFDRTYIDTLLKIVDNYKVTAIISLNDFELPILSEKRALFEQKGVKLIVSNPFVIDTCLDKWKTFNFIENLGLNTPKTYISLDSAIADVKKGELEFPLVLKPRWGSGSLGISYPESIEELKLSYELLKLKLQRCIISKIKSSESGSPIVIQEKLIGMEYGMDIINNFKGNYFGTFTRKKIAMRCGETDIAISVIDERFNVIGEKISKNLYHTGIMDCDVFITKNNQLYVLELNPRFGGGYPFSHKSGINIAAIYIAWLNNNTEEIQKHNNYKANIVFSKYNELINVTKTSNNIDITKRKIRPFLFSKPLNNK